jgi:CarboxypepD_reg-like domain
MRHLFFLPLCFWASATFSQNNLSGKILDEKKQPLPGASIFLKGTYDGSSTDTTGFFSFKTAQTDTGTLVISFIGYLTLEKKIRISSDNQAFILKEDVATQLREVTVTAGVFEASDEKRTTILKPIDIVTTAGALADVFKALQVLPGASQVGEQEGLFVRGGSASETKAVIDGLIVQNPFFSSVPDVAQRGRFSPFQFKGTSFSSGGYPAQYGQALSSVLLLNTNDLAPKSQLTAGINFASIYGGYVKRWSKTSLDVNLNGFNVGPVLLVVNRQNIDWKTAPQGQTMTTNFRHQTSKTGLLKIYTSLSGNRLKLTFADPSAETGKTTFGLKNINFYSNATFTETLGKYRLYAGFSQSFNDDQLDLDTTNANRGDQRTQFRLSLAKDVSNNLTVTAGAELHYAEFYTQIADRRSWYREVYGAVFAEADVYFTKKLVGRLGIRAEHSAVIGRQNVAPRVSLAYKTGEHSQVSGAFGVFYQNPGGSYQFRSKDLDFEKATHFILNYQRIHNNRTFRVEAYRKNYSQLVREFTGQPFNANPFRFPSGQLDNSGSGYAQGAEIFFRDNKTFKRGEYWISYSYLDTRRLFANYPQQAMPAFAANHTLNVLYKHFIPKIATSLNATYTFSSGRPYYNPNHAGFMSDRTPEFHNLSLSANYLTNIGGNFTVIYAEVGNVLGIQNVFGYRYSADGTQRIATNPPSYRSFFLGMQITIDKVKK